MKVSIIIVNYNTDELTMKAIKSVFKFSKGFDFEIIIIDNNSKDSNLETLLRRFENTFFYTLNKNIGFGKANNFGFEKCKGDFIFLLNSDAYLIEENTLGTLVEYLETHDNVACVGGNLVTEDGRPNISHGKFLSIDRLLFDYGLKKVSEEYFKNNLVTASSCGFKIPTPVDHLTGAAVMIKRSVIEKLGLFDTNYFMYLEDMELCFRFKKHGYLSVILPDVKMVHLGGRSSCNDLEMSKRIINEIAYSKYLFLQNVTAKHVAFGLFLLGKMHVFQSRLKRKVRKIIYG